jgi:type II secretory pathway pseudopilin PulG
MIELAARLRRDEGGFTLTEMLAALSISIVVMGAVLTALDHFTSVSRATSDRNDAGDQARQSIRDLARNLRNIASPAQSGSGIERGTATDLVFQTINPLSAGSGSNTYSTQRVRYCLNSSDPKAGTLWKQVDTWSTASPPALPSQTACPHNQFGNGQQVIGSWVANAAPGGPARPLFTYDSATLEEISNVSIDLYIDRDRTAGVGEAQMETSVFLRNKNRAPAAAFEATPQGNKQVLLNGGTSSDPDGQTLTYSWMVDGATISATGPIVTYTVTSTGNHTFALTVTDGGGLAHTSPNQTVNVQ